MSTFNSRKRSRRFAECNVKGKKGIPLSLKTKVLATIRYLAGGMRWDICLAMGIGFGTFFADSNRGVVCPILDAIDESFSIGLDLNRESLRQKSVDFANICPLSSDVFNGVVLAIDGWVMRTRQPYRSEVAGEVMSYRNRKGCWGIVVLGMCKPDYNYQQFLTSGLHIIYNNYYY